MSQEEHSILITAAGPDPVKTKQNLEFLDAWKHL